MRRKPFTVDVMIINGNGQKIQVCNLLILNTKNVAWLNWHVARYLTKKNLKSHPKNLGGGLATLHKYEEKSLTLSFQQLPFDLLNL